MTRQKSESCQIANLNDIYSRFIGDEKRTFADIGAHDGYSFSNTWGLAMVGWEGLMVEPLPDLYKKCEELYKDHPLVYTCNCAAGPFDGKTKLFIGDFPTIDKEIVAAGEHPWKEQGYSVNPYNPDNFLMVDVVTMDDLIDLHELNSPIDVVSIDVEGGEWDVLSGWTYQLHPARMVIIETMVTNPHVDAINAWFAETGMTLIQQDGLNAIYWNKEL